MSKILSSWKEIAQYLGKGVRTVQRWEHAGLPVKRPKSGPQAVIAYTDEIDAWINAGVSDAHRDLQARVWELEAEVARLKAQPGRTPAANTINEEILKLSALRVTSVHLRLDALRSQIASCSVLCDTCEIEIRYGEIRLAGRIVTKIKRAIETMKRHLNDPNHVPPEDAKKLGPELSRLEARVELIESHLTQAGMTDGVEMGTRISPQDTIH